MPFVPKAWQNYPNTSTPISAAALIDLETRVTPTAILPVANGSDDTTAIQAVLTAAGVIRAPTGQSYIISAPLVIKSNTTLDLTGCTVTLKAGTGGNMLLNTAVTAARTVIDGAITTGTATLTSATATFTGADVGKAVTVVDAGTSGQRLQTTIAGFTNSTTVTLSANAAVSVTNAWVTIGTRDQNITLIGGLWDRAANGSALSGPDTGKGYSNNSIRLRRLDGLGVEGVEVASTNGKYGVNPGDVWDFTISEVHARTAFSDIVHINGPARHGDIRSTSAEIAGDDIVSITASDFNTVATMADIAGDVSKILVDGVTANYGTRRGVILMAGTAPAALGNRAVTVTSVTIRNVQGNYANETVHVGGDFQDAATLGGTYSGVLVDDAKGDARSVTQGTVLVPEGTFEDLTIRNVIAGVNHDRPVQVGGANASQSATIRRLVVDRVYWPGGTSPNGFVTVIRGTVTSLEVANSQGVTTSTGTNVLTVSAASATPTVSRALILNCDLEVAVGGSVSALVRVETGTTLGLLKMTNCHTKNVTYPLGRYFAACNVVATNVQCEGASALVRTEVGAALILQSTNVVSNNHTVSSGGGTIAWLTHKPAQISTKSAAYTIDGHDDTVLGNATGGVFNVTLPTAVGIDGRRFTVKKTDASANAVTVNTTSSQTIDGATTYALSVRWKYVTVESDGANWQIVANN